MSDKKREKEGKSTTGESKSSRLPEAYKPIREISVKRKNFRDSQDND